MNTTTMAAGTPIVNVWWRDVGIAVGHIETRPKLVSQYSCRLGTSHPSPPESLSNSEIQHFTWWEISGG
jgi:hypothetical protein